MLNCFIETRLSFVDLMSDREPRAITSNIKRHQIDLYQQRSEKILKDKANIIHHISSDENTGR